MNETNKSQLAFASFFLTLYVRDAPITVSGIGIYSYSYL